jgi:hypothetical protein
LEGVLTICNFNARLQLWHLSFGGSSKDTDDTQAGQHGEGMKLGIVVFRKYPYCHTVRVEASGFSWFFNFNKDHQLLCRLQRVSRERIKKEKRAAVGQRQITNPRCWADVSIVVGEPKRTMGENGVKEKGQQISLVDFEEWLFASISKPPALSAQELVNMFSTQHTRTSCTFAAFTFQATTFPLSSIITATISRKAIPIVNDKMSGGLEKLGTKHSLSTTSGPMSYV